MSQVESNAAELRALTEQLEHVASNRALLAALSVAERTRLLTAAGALYCPDPTQRRQLLRARLRREKAERRGRDEARLEDAGIRTLRREKVFTTPNYRTPPPALGQGSPEDHAAQPPEVVEPQNCYVCKRDYTRLHPFYDQLCPECGDFNLAKRSELADLRGRVALITGARVKIGYQAGIKLLRCGAELIVTTRFPRDAALRYAAEPDFAEWGHRLQVFGLDLRHTPSVEAFCRHMLTTRSRLDFIINNACQTVRRPPDFYRHMLASETASERTMPESARRLLGDYEGLRGYSLVDGDDQGNGHGATLVEADRHASVAGLIRPAELSQVPLLPEEIGGQAHLFPQGQLDADLQQVDLRDRNSWRLLLHEVSSVELLEVQLVNAIAPFVLNARLKPLLLRTPGREKHVVNVSAMEGQFYRKFKTTRHPHTNMAKAALNMMTRTSAADYHADGIHMNAVDTGWVTDEDPAAIAARKREQHRFHPPLDIVDGAARIVDPIISGVNSGVHVWGQFLKDYRPTDW